MIAKHNMWYWIGPCVRKENTVGRLVPSAWGLCGGGSAVQCWVPNWEGRALATQESVRVFGRYTLENSRLTGHHVKKKKMEQKW